MSIILESQMISSPVTRLNITVTHSLQSLMGNTSIIGSWSRDSGLVSDEITKIDKGKKWIKMITNVVLTDRWEIDVCWEVSSSDSRETETRDTKEKNK